MVPVFEMVGAAVVVPVRVRVEPELTLVVPALVKVPPAMVKTELVPFTALLTPAKPKCKTPPAALLSEPPVMSKTVGATKVLPPLWL